MYKNLNAGGGADTGALSDQVVQLQTLHTGRWADQTAWNSAQTLWNNEQLRKLQELAITRQTQAAVVIAPDLSTIYTAIADLQTETTHLRSKLEEIDVPSLSPILSKLFDLETRLKFNEKAALNHGKETLKAAIAVLEARLTDQNALIAQADMFRAKTLADQNHKIKLLWRSAAILAVGMIGAYVYILL